MSPTIRPEALPPALNFQPRKPIRYKQRPAATPPPPPPPPVTPVNILSVTRLSGTSVRVLFDGDPMYNGIGGAGAEFLVNGGGFQFVADSAPDGVELSYEFQDVNVGDPWELTAQPAWAGVPVSAPASGLVE